MISNQQPSITTGLRGLSYVEVKLQVQTATCIPDCGGAVNQSTCWLKWLLRFMMRTTTLPFRFYDNVEELSTEEAEMAKAPFSLENIRKPRT
jgi:hypothetical protein